MNTEEFLWLAALINAHPDGKVVGRKRLQKEVMILQNLGFPTTYRYKTHFYGPYSEALHSDVGLLEQFNLVKETIVQTQQGEPCYMMQSIPGCVLPNVSEFQAIISKLSDADSIILELAATYESFRDLGADHEEAIAQLHRKKGSKCEEGREEAAMILLQDLGLPHG